MAYAGAGGTVPPARRGARPVAGRRIPGARLSARLQGRLFASPGDGVVHQAPAGAVADIAGHRNALILTFRRNGAAVPTPVWAAVDGEAIYVRTERESGKVKRLRRVPHALIAPCTRQGRPLGAPLEVAGRVLETVEEAVAERALAERYGRGREVFERTMDVLRVDMAYLEFLPTCPQQD